MTITARIIKDSCQEGGRNRLTTFVLRYPRFIHAEFMTHRVFSRNAASSRAIPVAKMIQAVIDDPAMPVWWGKNQAGMQAKEELSDDDWDIISIPGPVVESTRQQAKTRWLKARDTAVEHVQELVGLNLHKQIANRILEPWAHIEVIVTATNWSNFYALRNHPDAQPEIQELARLMLEAHENSVPEALKSGEWHLPYIKFEDRIAALGWSAGNEPEAMAALRKVSAAKCARVSYLNHEGKATTLKEDFDMFDRLMGGDVKHASPTEHQARVPTEDDYEHVSSPVWPFKYPSNLDGWVQHRKLIEGETIHKYRSFDK